VVPVDLPVLRQAQAVSWVDLVVPPEASRVVRQAPVALEVPVDLRVAKDKGGPEDSRAARPALTAAPVDLPVVRQAQAVSWADLVVPVDLRVAKDKGGPEDLPVVRQALAASVVLVDLRLVRQAQAVSRAAPVAPGVLQVARRPPQDLTPADSVVLAGPEDLPVVRQALAASVVLVAPAVLQGRQASFPMLTSPVELEALFRHYRHRREVVFRRPTTTCRRPHRAATSRHQPTLRPISPAPWAMTTFKEMGKTPISFWPDKISEAQTSSLIREERIGSRSARYPMWRVELNSSFLLAT
jgi:hypothetical protein